MQEARGELEAIMSSDALKVRRGGGSKVRQVMRMLFQSCKSLFPSEVQINLLLEKYDYDHKSYTHSQTGMLTIFRSQS